MMKWHLDIRDTYRVEIRDLRALLTVVRCGSFTAAARELGYTQPAVSQQVAALEQEVGQVLVQRRPVRATPAGERLAEHAARILLRLDVARSELSRLGDASGEVRVGICPLAAPDLLAAALAGLRAAHPLLRVTVRSADPRSAVADVAAGRVDAALADGITAPNEPLHLADAGLLSSTAMAETPLVVTLAAGHPLRGRPSIDLDMLADAPWAVAPAPAALAGRGPSALAQPAGSAVYDGTDLPTLLALVAAGLGAALLPASAGPLPEGVVAIPLRRPALVHRTELLALRTASARQRLVIDGLAARARVS
jgi:DNA-binding transcriptional LysR family regulator